MHYFAENQLSRIDYQNSLKLENILDKNDVKNTFKYNKGSEYVAIWYDTKFEVMTVNRSNAMIPVYFANLTNPTYENSSGRQVTSYFKANVPLDTINKIPFGSIWQDGRCNSRFQLNTYEFTITPQQIIEFISTADVLNLVNHYFDKLRFSPHDSNENLLSIQIRNQTLLIHPIMLFAIHYGYSMNIKRILAKYNWNEVEKRLIIQDDDVEEQMEALNITEYVIIPSGMTQRDAVFLHALKYNENIHEFVSTLNANIIKSQQDNAHNIQIDFWHKPVKLRFKGIQLGEYVLCASPVGISEFQGKNINIALKPRRRKNKTGQDDNAPTIRIARYTHHEPEEQLDITIDPVNNLTFTLIVEKLQQLGALRGLNLIRPPDIEFINNPVDYHAPNQVNNWGIGEIQGANGNTGLADFLYDITSEEVQSRFKSVWEHAIRLREEKGATVESYSFKQGFQTDRYTLISLDNLHIQYKDSYKPEKVLILRVRVQGQTFFTVELGGTSSGLVYRVDEDENFVEEGLLLLLTKIVAANGSTNPNFVDSYKGKLAKFNHAPAKNNDNNWVWNGIKKLLRVRK